MPPLPEDPERPFLPWSKEETIKALLGPLGPKCFVNRYLKHAEEDSDVPLWYHVGCLLTLLGVLAPDTYIYRRGNRKTITNNFALLLGRSGDGKSSATQLVESLLMALDDGKGELVGKEPISSPALVKSLSRRNRQWINYTEFSSFLKRTRGNAAGAVAALKPDMNTAWDGGRLSYSPSDHANEVYVNNPRLTATFCIVESMLPEHSEPEDYKGGLYSRTNFFYAYCERVDQPSRSNPADFGWLVSWCKAVYAITPEKFQACSGLSVEAQRILTAYNTAVRVVFQQADNRRLDAIQTRYAQNVLRVALLLSFGMDKGRPDPQDDVGLPWEIDATVMTVAVNLVLRCLTGAVAAYLDGAVTREVQEQQLVIGAVPPEGATFGGLLRATNLSKRRLTELLETLDASETIRLYIDGINPPVYKKVRPIPRVPGARTAMGIHGAVEAYAQMAKNQTADQKRALKIAEQAAAAPGVTVGTATRVTLTETGSYAINFDFTGIDSTSDSIEGRVG